MLEPGDNIAFQLKVKGEVGGGAEACEKGKEFNQKIILKIEHSEVIVKLFMR